ncbi:hypothetical protein HanPSC8_Chr15g0645241 [Helianthus annuus]|nr:hypothetical protein HanPSC8_Chr15g0645241 [Helianthus annuus]
MVALAERGMFFQSLSCPMFGGTNETTDHVLVKCPVADMVWSQVLLWLKIPRVSQLDSVVDVLELVNGLDPTEEGGPFTALIRSQISCSFSYVGYADHKGL